MSESFVSYEATGVYIGELQEDMIKTVARTKSLCCDVLVEPFYCEGKKYPLTAVPLWAMSLPLVKGDKVMVKFNQNNLMYPVLYKNPEEIDEGFFEKFDVKKSVEGGGVTAPESEDTVSAQRLGADAYVIKTKSYSIIHQNNAFVLIDSNDNFYVYGAKVNVICDGDFKADVGGDAAVFVKGKCEVKADGGFKVNNHLEVKK